jgi:hypothetical protein
MAEDYTYQPIQTTAQMQARIRELEAQLNAAIMRWNAVPVDAIRHLVGPSPIIPGRTESAWDELEAWLKRQAATP